MLNNGVYTHGQIRYRILINILTTTVCASKLCLRSNQTRWFGQTTKYKNPPQAKLFTSEFHSCDNELRIFANHKIWCWMLLFGDLRRGASGSSGWFFCSLGGAAQVHACLLLHMKCVQDKGFHKTDNFIYDEMKENKRKTRQKRKWKTNNLWAHRIFDQSVALC